jgi:hypothetical protein
MEQQVPGSKAIAAQVSRATFQNAVQHMQSELLES